MNRLIAILTAAVLLGGCAKTTSLAEYNQVKIQKEYNTLVLTHTPLKQRGNVLLGHLAGLSSGDVLALIKVGENAKVKNDGGLRGALLRGGVRPDNIRMTRTPGEAVEVIFTIYSIEYPKYREQPYEGQWYNSEALSAGFGISTRANLAAQYDNLAEIEQPLDLGAPSSIGAVGPVEAYNMGSVRSLLRQSMQAGGN